MARVIDPHGSARCQREMLPPLPDQRFANALPLVLRQDENRPKAIPLRCAI